MDRPSQSGGGDGHALARSRPLDDAFDHARTRGVLVVVAAGNHGHVGPAPLLTHPWALPVTACDPLGGPLPGANLGIGIGRSGLRAPGLRVLTTTPGCGYQPFSGTSAAAPLRRRHGSPPVVHRPRPARRPDPGRPLPARDGSSKHRAASAERVGEPAGTGPRCLNPQRMTAVAGFSYRSRPVTPLMVGGAGHLPEITVGEQSRLARPLDVLAARWPLSAGRAAAAGAGRRFYREGQFAPQQRDGAPPSRTRRRRPPPGSFRS